MDFQQLTNSRLGVGAALWLGRILPQRVGYPFTRWIADRISSRQELKMVQAVRANQWVVSGCQLSPAQLDVMAKRVFRHIARCQFDLYHNLQNERGLIEKVESITELEHTIQRIKAGGAGLLVCPHLSNFDLMGRVMALCGLKYLALTVPDPVNGYQMQNMLREQAGIDTLPISITAIRQATERLQQGGVVLTGVDRPVQGEKYRPRFFGRPSALPVMHIRMAIKTGVPITVVACQMKPGGKYHLLASDPISMQTDRDLVTETERNAEAVLAVVEQWIKDTPEQWSMTYPIWPEALQEVNKHS